MKKSGRKEKVIVMTGNPSALSFSDKEMPHIVSHLLKPFGVEKLLNAVISAMGGVDVSQTGEYWHASPA
jgi:DNA-binding NtrC family response regulator